MNNITPYTILAQAYDYLLRHVDYETWFEYIKSIIRKYYGHPDLIIELGCGTGRFGAKFSRDGFNILGVDRSLDMLRVARTRAYKHFSVVCADIRQFHMSAAADFIFSVHDTMNYIVKPGNLRRVLRCVRNIMHDTSVFMFDLTTEYNIDTNFDGRKMEYETRGLDVTWDNSYDREKKLVYSILSFTEKDGRKSVETHLQRIYAVDYIRSLLHEERFEILDIYGDYSLKAPVDDTVMVNYIVRKKQ